MGLLEDAMSIFSGDSPEPVKPTARSKKSSPRRAEAAPSPWSSLRYGMPVPVGPMPAEMFGTLSSRENYGLREQKESFRELSDQLAKMKENNASAKDEMDLTPLLLAADMANGTKYSSMYKAPTSKNQRQEQIAGLEAMLGKAAGDLSKSEVNLLKAQIQPTKTGSVSLKAANWGGSKKKNLSASESRKLSQLSALGPLAEGVLRAWEDSSESISEDDGFFKGAINSGVGGIKALLGVSTPQKRFRDTIDATTQTFAKAMEGRVSNADYKRFLGMMPTSSDNYETALQKIQFLKKQITDKHNVILKGFQGLYNTGSGHQMMDTTPPSFKGRYKGKGKVKPRGSLKENKGQKSSPSSFKPMSKEDFLKQRSGN